MFDKKECNRCGEKTGANNNFCPNCGVPFNGKSQNEKHGMLGENDFEDYAFENTANSLFGNMGGKMMGKVFENAVRMLEKEIQREMKREQPRTNFQLFINGKKIKLNQDAEPAKKKKNISVNLPEANLKKFASLPKQEPETQVRRFSDKIIYEVNMPGIKSEKDISVVKLENSIEVKAAGNNVAYKKIIPINLPITDYKVSNEKLTLEFSGE